MNARRLILIGVVALVAITGAFWLSSQRGLPRAVQAGEPVLPGFEARINDVTELRIARGDGTTTTLRRSDAGWRVLERDYPADENAIRRLLFDAARLEIVEEKTSDPKRYAQLQVDDVSGPAARGTLLTFFEGGKADTATALILGKTDGSRNLFVRPSGAQTSLLASPQLLADADPRRWLATALLDIKAERVRRVSITARNQPTYIAERGDAEGAPLALTAVPAGRAVADQSAVDALAGALAELRFEDVLPREPAGERSLSSGAEARFETRDGLTVDLRERELGARRLLTIEAAGNSEPSRAEAARINARVAGREFEIAAFRAAVLFRPLDELLLTP
jgi:hypothetical protein